MGLADESMWNVRQIDDETQRILVQFFNSVATDPYFQNMYHALNAGEQQKLQEMNMLGPV